jgi:23S rRNA-/tRNA-specific pseudouridylate synthase
MKRSLTATILTITVAAPPMLSCAFSLVPLPLSHLPPHLGQHASARTRTTCNAKLDKIASSFDLNKILPSEKEFSSFDDDALTSGKKKNKLKEQMRQQRQEMQQLKKKNRDKNSSRTNENILHNGRDFDDDTLDVDSRTEYENLIQNISFSAHEIPSSVDGRRIDAVLVELLNNECDDKGQTSSLSISRTQCGTLLSNKCVFVVPPEDAHIFRNALNAHYDNESDATAVPRVLIEQHCSPIQRKSHILESQSILVYPTRESLFPTSSSSSTLLSNLVPPAEIIAQKIPLDILYEDEHMIVINKQAGIVV